MNWSRLAGLCTALVIGSVAWAADDAPMTVVRFALDNERTTPYVVLTYPNEATAVEVPYEIEDWAGRGITPDPQQIAGDYFIALRPGEKLFFVSPLIEGVTRTLHIVMRGHDYPIELRPSAPAYAFRKVIFFDPAAERAAVAAAAQQAKTKALSENVKRLRTMPRQPLAPATDELQIGLIHFMQMLANLPEQQAEQMIEANRQLTWSRRENEAPFDAGDYRIHPLFVVRNNVMKSIGLAVRIENTSRRIITFLPDSFVLRSGNYVYPQTAADFNPRLAPGASAIGFFVIARTPDGGAVQLAPDTPMTLSLALASTTSAQPATALDLGDIIPPETSK